MEENPYRSPSEDQVRIGCVFRLCHSAGTFYDQESTKGVKAQKSPLVSNEKSPVGPAQRPGLGLTEPRDY